MNTPAAVIKKLGSINPTVFRIIGGAAEFASVQQAPKAFPAAFVMSLQEASGANERMTGRILQPLSADIGIVIITSNLSDPRGAAGSNDIETLKKVVRSHLIGFVPHPEEDGLPLEHVSGELLKAWGGNVWWQEVFAAARYIEEQPEAGEP